VDHLSIEQLFLRYGPGVGSYLMARLGNAELAEEITARVFLTVVREYAKCRGSGVGWLWSIVRSELARHFRGRCTQPLPEEIADPSDPPGAALSRREMQFRIQAALGQLDDEQQQIITMKFFLRLKNKDIAEALGQSASNIGVKVHRAIRRLQEMIEKDGPP
jgi:RNA polymerase sigma-70 factor (ECF subfamily)